MNSIAVLGSTGSIGTSCLEVVRAHPHRLRVTGISAFRSHEKLSEQAAEFRTSWAVLGDPDSSHSVSGRVQKNPETAAATEGPDTRWYRGMDILPDLLRRAEINTVVSAVVGSAGLPATWAAVDSGKRVALANKESLVMAGSALMRRAAETGAMIIPVDSEHSAIFQCLQAGRREEVRRIILTASGGPFRGWTSEQLQAVTPEQAVRHPTWQMGRKISVDSATMMNKALEIVEARWLFGLPASQISVVIHPQSYVHSLVEYRDGSVISQMSPPDMRLPIQYALLFPERHCGVNSGPDWRQPLCLELLPPDFEAFPALRLGFEVAESGGTAGAVMNGANEVAVARFLNRELRFDQITKVVQDVVRNHRFDEFPSMEQLMNIDAWARKEAFLWKI